MRPRRRSKSESKTAIFEYPERILVDTSNYEVDNLLELKSNLQTIIQRFKDQKLTSYPIYLEIGMGNGQFLNQLAIRNKNALCIGVEVKEERIMTALEEADQNKLENTIILRVSAIYLDKIILEQQIDTIFMNFPDPWPKKRHTKNRMTTEKYINVYKKILKKEGQFIFKSDNENMFEYTLGQLKTSNADIQSTTKALKNDENNIQTQFEKRYREKGKPILQIIAKMQ